MWIGIKKKLFCNGHHYYAINDVAASLDIVSSQDSRGRYNAAPNPSKILWGQALLSAVAIKDSMDGIGLRGSNEQLNAKKAIVASCAKLDPTNNKLQNEKLLKALLPHKSCSGKTKFVKSCTERRAKFEATGDAKAFCHEEKTQQREN